VLETLAKKLACAAIIPDAAMVIALVIWPSPLGIRMGQEPLSPA
jgi:hypothetical protein